MTPRTRGLLIVSTFASLTAAGKADDALSLPVAKARPVGVVVATTQTAQGDVNRAVGFVDRKQYLAFDVDRPAGMYRVKIRYRADGGKAFDLKVNGLTYTGAFPAAPEFSDHDAGLIELSDGKGEITLGGGWGHYEIAGLELTPARPDAPPKTPSRTLVNPDASPEAHALFDRLLAAYGRSTFSGVHEFGDVRYVKENTGHDVAVLSRDLMDYSPSRLAHGTKPGDMTEKVIADARTGRAVTLCWHWNAPKDLIDKVETLPNGKKEDKSWFFGFYTRATTYDFRPALADDGGEDRQLLLRDIDAIAVELKKLQAAGVPLLWRPLHEAEGGWFWWGARGPDDYVKLWRLLYDRLTRHHHLNNLIWVYTSAGDRAWYPGDDVVDVIGADAYPPDNRDPLVGIWNTLRQSFGDRKLLALTEFGTVPDIARMHRHGVYWSYFSTWGGKLGPRGMAWNDLQERLTSPLVHGKDTP